MNVFFVGSGWLSFKMKKHQSSSKVIKINIHYDHMITPGKSSPTSTASVCLFCCSFLVLKRWKLKALNLIQGLSLPSAFEPKKRKGSVFAIYILKVSFLRFRLLWAQQAGSNVERLNSYLKKPPRCFSIARHCSTWQTLWMPKLPWKIPPSQRKPRNPRHSTLGECRFDFWKVTLQWLRLQSPVSLTDF